MSAPHSPCKNCGYYGRMWIKGRCNECHTKQPENESTWSKAFSSVENSIKAVPILGPVLGAIFDITSGALAGIVLTALTLGFAMVAPWLFFPLAIGIGIYIWVGRTAPERAARQAIMEEEKRKNAEEQFRQKEKFAELMRQQEEAKVAQYRHLRKEIEAMPQYEHWRQLVFGKFGRKCGVCGSTENLEVDHRYKSFYAILREYGIENVVQAYECKELWDVNNGAPLCKTHHDQTTNSRYRASK